MNEFARVRAHTSTAQLIVNTAKEHGVYFAIALVHDLNYTREEVAELLPILEGLEGATTDKIKR